MSTGHGPQRQAASEVYVVVWISSRIGGPDTIGPADAGRRVEPGAALARQRMNMDHDPLTGDHPETGHVSTGALPSDTDVQALISAGYERYRHLGEGGS
jgi:hypothetical protein